MSSIPAQQTALVCEKPGKLRLANDIALPELQPGEVLIATKAIALNPSDWKLLDYSAVPGAIAGADFAGVVVKVADDPIKLLKPGDRVLGTVFGSNPGRPSNGAFSNYIAAKSELCIRIPHKMNFATAASLSMGLLTAGYAMRSLRLEFPESDNIQSVSTAAKNTWILVYGGATATGTIMIQILKLAGYKIVTTCSAKNYALVESLGAKKAFDYHSPTCAKDIRAYTDDSIHHTLDTICSTSTAGLCYSAMGAGPGRYTSLEPCIELVKATRPEIHAEWVLGWTAFGDAVELDGVYQRPPMLADLIYCSQWADRMEGLLAKQKIKAHPQQTAKTGLSGAMTGVDMLRKGAVSGKKLVYVM